MKEMVLYYAPENAVNVGLVKGVLVQMGIRIKNLTPGRCEKKIGYLAGLDGFEDEGMVPDRAGVPGAGQQASPIPVKYLNAGGGVFEPRGNCQTHVQAARTKEHSSCPLPAGINEELLVLCGFTEERLEQLLVRLKKAGVPRSVMKAIVTESNAHWTVYELYGHLAEERRQIERG